jgi:hypothetical protein
MLCIDLIHMLTCPCSEFKKELWFSSFGGVCEMLACVPAETACSTVRWITVNVFPEFRPSALTETVRAQSSSNFFFVTGIPMRVSPSFPPAQASNQGFEEGVAVKRGVSGDRVSGPV